MPPPNLSCSRFWSNITPFMCLLCANDAQSTQHACRTWSLSFLELKCEPKGSGAAIVAEGTLPLPPRVAFELLCHPLAAERVYSNINRCTYRRVVCEKDDGAFQAVEVETESGELGSSGVQLHNLMGSCSRPSRTGIPCSCSHPGLRCDCATL